MAWQKPSEDLVDFFNKVVPDLPGIEKKKMFGHPAAFINNNMFIGLNGERMTIKLSDNDREEFLKLDGTKIFECTPGKTWNQYVEIPECMYDDIHILKDWIERSFDYVSGLPCKENRKKIKPISL